MGQLGVISEHSVVVALVGRPNCNIIEKLYIFYVYNIFYGYGYILSNTIFLQFYPIQFDTFPCQTLWCYSIIHAVSLFTGCCATLRPSDTIWRHRSGSILAQVMACCLTAPSHYLNQCWLIISKVLWHSSEGSYQTHWTFLQFYPILFDTFSCQALWWYSIINATSLFTGCCATLSNYATNPGAIQLEE